MSLNILKYPSINTPQSDAPALSFGVSWDRVNNGTEASELTFADALDLNNITPSITGNYITVTVTYVYNHLFSKLTGFGQTTITGETIMRVE